MAGRSVEGTRSTFEHVISHPKNDIPRYLHKTGPREVVIVDVYKEIQSNSSNLSKVTRKKSSF